MDIQDRTLGDYLRGSYLTEKRELVEVADCLAEVLPVFVATWDKRWPYEVRNGSAVTERSTSHSTNAMIAFSLATLYPRPQAHESTLVPSVTWHGGDDIVKTCAARLDKACEGAFGKKFRERFVEIAQAAFTQSMTDALAVSDDDVCESNTFGKNDPLTICWLVELLLLEKTVLETDTSKFDAATKKIVAAVEKRSKQLIRGGSGELDVPLQFPGDSELRSLRHAFPYLRSLQLALSTERLKGGARHRIEHAEKYWQFFERLIHLHLSYYKIPDSRFDPAELVFALEGAILASGIERLDAGTIERVFTVLEECQEHNPYWRPVAPFVSTRRGKVLLPISVEIANSLLRICRFLDRDNLHDTYFSRFLGLLRRYKRWIFSRRVAGEFSDGAMATDLRKFCGWHSEHVGELDTIHLWETSQVVTFLLHYSAMLREHVARQALIYGRFELRRPRKNARASWTKYVTGEPVASTEAKSFLNAYAKINEYFVEPRDSRSPPSEYSMLLYGPPGTGKSTVAEKLADGLSYRLITITASDFLAGGGAEVEARAKAIFDALSEQTNAVVLFDEMDHFLLNRDSKLYQHQESIFQFMTPGMLTKINDLRSHKRALFIIATNYAERIDPAAKRSGRIDRHILLLPPSKATRMRILKQSLAEAAPKGVLKEEDILDAVVIDAAVKSKLMTWTELSRLGRDAVRRADPRVPEELAKALLEEVGRSQASISVASYKSRFVQNDDVVPGPKPFDEFVAIQLLDQENNLNDIHQCKTADEAALMIARRQGAPKNLIEAWTTVFTAGLGLNGPLAGRLAADAKQG